jgi:hypothetical protein
LDASGNVVCTDQKVTAGNPDHILLTVAAPIVNPATGETFKITANGSDAAFILAAIVDAQGNWCPTASNIVHFSVTGPGNYRGGADQMIGGGGANYHSPGDPELSAEGGMCKVAVRSMFTTGTVTVTATSPGLGEGNTSFTVYPLGTTTVEQGQSPSIRESSLMPAVKIVTVGSTLRYFISNPASVSFDILDASGRVLNHVPGSRQMNGWHPILLAGTGVYFVRFAVDGQYLSVKRMVIVK